jgi:hypothetical protein
MEIVPEDFPKSGVTTVSQVMPCGFSWREDVDPSDWRSYVIVGKRAAQKGVEHVRTCGHCQKLLKQMQLEREAQDVETSY